MQSVISNAYRDAFFRSIITLADWVLNMVDPDVLIHLFTNDFMPTGATVPGDFVEPTFTGYAAVTGGGVAHAFQDPATQDWVLAITSGVLFQPTNNVALPQTVYGYYIVNNGGDAILWAARFDEPFVFQSSANALLFTPELRLLAGGLS